MHAHQDRPEPRWVLWAGTVGFDSSLSERFAAAASAGYERVSVSPPEVLRAEQGGVPASDIGRSARDLGLDLVLDPVMNWYPDSSPSPSRFAGVSAEDALRVGADLQAVALTVISNATSDVPVRDLPDHFGRVCDRAGVFGAEVQLEFMPFTIVRSVGMAWDLVRAAARDNGGIVFDTWHFFRGEPDFDLLATVPGERIFSVQLDDAAAAPEGPLRQETARRLLPGDGQLDLSRAIRALTEIGGLRWVGPEVLNPELAARPTADVARIAMARTRAVLDAALAKT